MPASISNRTQAAVEALFIVLISPAANPRLQQLSETVRHTLWISMLFYDEITSRRDFRVDEIISGGVLRMKFRR